MPKGIYNRSTRKASRITTPNVTMTETGDKFTVTLTKSQVISLIELMTTAQSTKG